MNILYLHSHDSGRYLGPYGHAVPTPALNKLAAEGVVFRHGFCASPTCSPSRACLLTSEHAHQNGMLGLVTRGFRMHDYSHHMCHTLSKAGYTTVLAGLQHIAPKREDIGFDQVLYPRSERVVDVAPLAVKYLQNAPKEPFFMDCGFFETHRDYSGGQQFGYAEATPLDNPNFIQPPAFLPDNADTRKDMAGFYASARQLDEGIKAVLDALATTGLDRNTLVISTTDHGIAFPHAKCNLFDSGIGVSLILRGPGIFSGGKACDALVSHVDLYPTLCDYLGIELPPWLEGKSFVPVLRGEREEVNEAIFAEVNFHASYEPTRAVRTKRWKYIRRWDDRSTDVLNNCDDGRSKLFWIQNGWRNEPLEQPEELYDLVFDPCERFNLVTVPAHQGTLNDMREHLNKWMSSTKDPLLRGHVPLPAGAVTFNRTCIGHHDYLNDGSICPP